MCLLTDHPQVDFVAVGGAANGGNLSTAANGGNLSTADADGIAAHLDPLIA